VTYAGEFCKLTWKFFTTNVAEIAETSVTLYPLTPPVPATTVLGEWSGANLTTTADYLATCLGGGSFAWGDYSILGSVKMSAHDNHGVTISDPLVVNLDFSRAGTVHQVHPQLSSVISLWSGHTAGKGNYGRMFLPHTSTLLVNGTPRSASADAHANALAAQTFIAAVNTLASAKTHPTAVTIMSQAAGTPAKLAVAVRCGSVTDTQRRRYDALDEEYDIEYV